MLTVVATCRQPGRSAPDNLTSCFEAEWERQVITYLQPQMESAIKVA
jgi:hypothetical protein